MFEGLGWWAWWLLMMVCDIVWWYYMIVSSSMFIVAHEHLAWRHAVPKGIWEDRGSASREKGLELLTALPVCFFSPWWVGNTFLDPPWFGKNMFWSCHPSDVVIDIVWCRHLAVCFMVCASISPWLSLTVPDFWCGFCVQCCLEAESQKQGEARAVLPPLFLNALKRRGCAMLRRWVIRKMHNDI